MSGPTPRPHRPALFSDLTELIDAAGGDAGPGSRAEIAAATAAAVVSAGREGSDPDDRRFVDLADRIGLDTLAALWRDSDPVSLPGALWALYLLRQWCHSHGEEVTLLWRAGEPVAAADAVVAGIPDYAEVTEVQRVADAVLAGAYQGDFAVALERAAALFRVVAAGRRRLAADAADRDIVHGSGGVGDVRDAGREPIEAPTAVLPGRPTGPPAGKPAADSDGATSGPLSDLDLAERNERVAADLAAAAARWRAGTLH